MAIDLQCFRIFIASPSGLGVERRAVRDEIDRYNQAEAMARGVLFLTAGPEAPFGGVGQQQTMTEIQQCDYFLLLLWDRWGFPPGAESNGFSNSTTEEEYRVALECQRKPDRPMRQLVVMYKAVSPQQLSDPGPQLERVLEFRKEVERDKAHRADLFDTARRCRTLVRRHLAAWLHEQESGSPSANMIAASALPDDDVDVTGAKEFEKLERPAEALTRKAWELWDAGRLTEAEVEFAKTVIRYEHPETLLSYGLFLCRSGRLDQARTVMERAVDIAEERAEAPAVANACESLGIVLQLGGDLDGAEKMYRKSLEAAERLGLFPRVAKVRSLLENLRGSTSA